MRYLSWLGCLFPLPLTQWSFNVFHLFAAPTSHNPRLTFTHTHISIHIHPHPPRPRPLPRRHAIRSDPDSRSLNSSHLHLSAPTLDRKFDCASESFQFFSTSFSNFSPISPTANIQSTSSSLSLPPRTPGPAVTPGSWETRLSPEAHLPN